jgi:hypothetical protein
MARVITADTFNRWWAALDGLEKKASRTSSSSQDDYRISGVHDVRTSLVICTSPLDTHVVQDGILMPRTAQHRSQVPCLRPGGIFDGTGWQGAQGFDQAGNDVVSTANLFRSI